MKTQLPKVAYFCMEYSLDNSSKIYSGGLGIQFSFNEKTPIKSRPDGYEKHCVVYTGIYDNNTLLAWYRGLKQSKNTRVLKISYS